MIKSVAVNKVAQVLASAPIPSASLRLIKKRQKPPWALAPFFHPLFRRSQNKQTYCEYRHDPKYRNRDFFNFMKVIISKQGKYT